MHSVQLCAGSGRRGVLEACAGTTLTQLQLWDCSLVDADGPASLASALQQLPSLQHLRLGRECDDWRKDPAENSFSTASDALQHLQGLTHLDLHHIELEPRDLGQLQGLSNLRGLRLHGYGRKYMLPQGLLANVPHLTKLEMHACFDNRSYMQPGFLVNSPQLQDLGIYNCELADVDTTRQFL